MFDEAVSISSTTIISDNVGYKLIEAPNNAIELKITQPSGINLSDVKSIIL